MREEQQDGQDEDDAMMAVQDNLEGQVPQVECFFCGQMLPRTMAKGNRDGQFWHSGSCYPVPLPEPKRELTPEDLMKCSWAERHDGWAENDPGKMSCIIHHHSRAKYPSEMVGKAGPRRPGETLDEHMGGAHA